ncbi:MAG: histidinol-phosphate transaminase [Gammaproteobacteria bacterium]
MSKFWTDIVQQLDPYVPGEQPQDQQYIKLNTNENPYPPSPAVTKAINSYAVDDLRRYPDPESRELRQALAVYTGLECEQIFVGNGSDEVLAHSFKTFFQGRDNILFPDIGYSFYPVYCSLYRVNYRTIALDPGFTIDVSDYRLPNGGIIIANPNAPTGITLTITAIRELLEFTDSVVVIDEAYVDFGAESCQALINEYPNLLVVQTFSKSRSLAGLRLGYAMGHVELIEGLNRVKNSFNSYPVDRLASAAAIASLGDEEYFQQCKNKIIESRNWLAGALRDLEFEVLDSNTNFLFARHSSCPAAQLYTELKTAGILVRHFETSRIENFIRISIGTDDECLALIETLKELL